MRQMTKQKMLEKGWLEDFFRILTDRSMSNRTIKWKFFSFDDDCYAQNVIWRKPDSNQIEVETEILCSG